MILSSSEILRRRASGDIVITPWNDANLNPNSYNLTLADRLLVYDGGPRQAWFLDARAENRTREIVIPDAGLILVPGELYLGASVEYTEAHGDLVPFIEGRSSLARLGFSSHCSAGFGDNQFAGNFVFEITVVKPLRIYPEMRIAQIAWLVMLGESFGYCGKYANQKGVVASKLWQEYSNK